ncbi:hypothetical protein [Mesorhizobium sp. M0522]|uniref:hypothetical protein n=1 Tax=unclassified Mesorhizobium TaxID=325217 RepID=UPI00333C8375
MTISIRIGIYAAPWVGRQGFDLGEGSNAASPLNGLMESALELLAHLGWVDGEKLVEAVFEGKPGAWRMVAAKAN